MSKVLFVSTLLFLLLFGLMSRFDITKTELVQIGLLSFLAGLIGGLVGWRFKKKSYNELLTITVVPIITAIILCFIFLISALILNKSSLANALGTTVLFSFGIAFYSALPSMIGCFITFKICKKANKMLNSDTLTRAG